MIWLAWLAMIVLLVRFLIVLINLFSGQWLKDDGSKTCPLVSVLIPARNEENNLPELLNGLLEQDYKNLEIIIYNDDSEDETMNIIRDFEGKDKRIAWINGKTLPEGWNGKNHACYQLAQKASGDYFLFLDADVRVRPGLIRKALRHSEKHNLTLLSIFPEQQMLSVGEKMTVPVMNWILLSLLPLVLIRISHFSSLAAANGQFMMFRAREYRHHQFHRLVRDLNVEDIHIMRHIKRMGYKGHTVLSRGEVECRMYNNFREGIHGFTRSMFAFFGGSGIALTLFTVLTTLGFLFVWLGTTWFYAVIYLAVALLLRIIVAGMSRQPVLWIALLAPLQQVSFVIMVIKSFRLRYSGKNLWKGRTIEFKGV